MAVLFGGEYGLMVGDSLDSESDLTIEMGPEEGWIDREAAIKLIAHLQKVFQIPVTEKTTRTHIPEGVTQVRNAVTGEVKQVIKEEVEDE